MSFCHHLGPLSSEQDGEEESEHYKCPSDFSRASSEFGPLHSRTKIFGTNKPPDIEHELNVAKSIMQQCSSITGDNLFDHLAEIIKRVIQNRPTNIVDYFEEFSHNVRAQKFRIQEQFPWTIYEPTNVEAAKSFLTFLKVPIDAEYDVCKEEKSKHPKSHLISVSSLDLSVDKFQRKILLNENVCRLHLYWALCGFEFQTDEIQDLAFALQKIQFQPSVVHARFWGKIYGLRKPYYIVEAVLTKFEMEKRLLMMREEMMATMCILRGSTDQIIKAKVDLDLVPGTHWQDSSLETLVKMQPRAVHIPIPKFEIQFNIPPEAVGTGSNRRTYFVVNSLRNDWIELPIVTPKQIQISRKIKKLLTGDLDADLVCYPNFPGTEKHYLRAMIARISAGTYIAPNGYYRLLTKKEQQQMQGDDGDLQEEEGEEEYDVIGEDEIQVDNDAIITENLEYDPKSMKLNTPNSWVHVRPNILEQGRVVYFDEERARKALEREATMRLMGEEEIAEEGLDEDIDEEGNIIDEDDKYSAEIGPALFTACNEDTNREKVTSWSPRYSSVHNKINQLAIMRSNLWPGAYSFAFDKYCDSIYLGWGTKYMSRNITVPHLPPIQEDFSPHNYQERLDPTPEMEELWRNYQWKLLHIDEEVVEDEDSCNDTH